jgi:hypothetical protein
MLGCVTRRRRKLPRSWGDLGVAYPFLDIDLIRGIDATFAVTDVSALRESLEAARLHPSQIDAVVNDKIDLATYFELRRSEVACLEQRGLFIDPLTVVENIYGVPEPEYGWAAGESMSEAAADLIQRSCQYAFTGAYASFYNARFQPSAEEQLERDIAAANRFIACAKDMGLEPPQETVQSLTDLDTFFSWWGLPEWDIPCKFEP